MSLNASERIWRSDAPVRRALAVYLEEGSCVSLTYEQAKEALDRLDRRQQKSLKLRKFRNSLKKRI